jgi:hypothetical protein
MRSDIGSHMTRTECPGGNHFALITSAGLYRKHNSAPGVECEHSRKRAKRPTR